MKRHLKNLLPIFLLIPSLMYCMPDSQEQTSNRTAETLAKAKIHYQELANIVKQQDGTPEAIEAATVGMTVLGYATVTLDALSKKAMSVQVIKEANPSQHTIARGWRWLAGSKLGRLVGWCKDCVWPNTPSFNQYEVNKYVVRSHNPESHLAMQLALTRQDFDTFRNPGADQIISDRIAKIHETSARKGTTLALGGLSYGLYYACHHDAWNQILMVSRFAKVGILLLGCYLLTQQLFPKIHTWWHHTHYVDNLEQCYINAIRKWPYSVKPTTADNAYDQYIQAKNIAHGEQYKEQRDAAKRYFDSLVVWDQLNKSPYIV